MTAFPTRNTTPNISGLSVIEEAFLEPVLAIQHVLQKGNDFLENHRTFLASRGELERQVHDEDELRPTTTSAFFELITAPPALHNRDAIPISQAPSNRNIQINQCQPQASAQLSQCIGDASNKAVRQVEQAFAASANLGASMAIASASSAVALANSSISAAYMSASSAIAVANSSAMVASSNLLSVSVRSPLHPPLI
jgi:hypothetical protein